MSLIHTAQGKFFLLYFFINKSIVSLADKTGDQASVCCWILRGLLQKEVKLSFILPNRRTFLHTKSRTLEYCWPPVLFTHRPRTPHMIYQSSLLLMTAFISPSWEDTSVHTGVILVNPIRLVHIQYVPESERQSQPFPDCKSKSSLTSVYDS